MAKTVAAAKANTKAKATAKAKGTATAAKGKATAAKGKGRKTKADTANPYELPPDADQSKLDGFWTSTTRRPGEVLASQSHDASAPAPGIEAAAVVASGTHEAETIPGTIGLEAASNVENEESKEIDDTQQIEAEVSALNPTPNDAAVETLPTEELPLATVSAAQADSGQLSLATVATGCEDVAPATGLAPGGSEDFTGQYDEILTAKAMKSDANEHHEKHETPMNTDETSDDIDDKSKSRLSSEAIEDYMARGTLNLYRGEDISLSEVSHFFRGFVSVKKWKTDVTTLVNKILTNDEVMSLVAQARNHPQIKEYELEVRGSDPEDIVAWSFGSDPDHTVDDLEHLIIWLVENEKITFVSEEEAKERLLESRH